MIKLQFHQYHLFFHNIADTDSMQNHAVQIFIGSCSQKVNRTETDRLK